MTAKKRKRVMVCRLCGVDEPNHCIPDFVAVPVGCVCSVGEWADEIPDPCDHYEPASGPGSYCKNCEHDEACHNYVETQDEKE